MVLNGLLSNNSNLKFQKKIQRLAHDFDSLIREDKGLSFDQRFGTTVVLAMRQWQYNLFEEFRKES